MKRVYIIFFKIKSVLKKMSNLKDIIFSDCTSKKFEDNGAASNEIIIFVLLRLEQILKKDSKFFLFLTFKIVLYGMLMAVFVPLNRRMH